MAQQVTATCWSEWPLEKSTVHLTSIKQGDSLKTKGALWEIQLVFSTAMRFWNEPLLSVHSLQRKQSLVDLKVLGGETIMEVVLIFSFWFQMGPILTACQVRLAGKTRIKIPSQPLWVPCLIDRKRLTIPEPKKDVRVATHRHLRCYAHYLPYWLYKSVLYRDCNRKSLQRIQYDRQTSCPVSIWNK